jgi:Holliday junction resolvasome RuvABC endonuclease subunit
LKILALDVATHCGFCTETAHGVWNLTPKRDESGGMRLIRFKAKLKETCEIEDISVVAFERTAGFHKNALIVQAELHGVLKVFCEENKIEYKAYSASEIKKYATGKGNAKKDLMIKAAREKLGYLDDNDNEADAMWIYELAKNDLKL